MLIPSLLLIAAVIILYFGAELSLDSSEKIGKKIGLSPLMVGMLLIGFGTSLPELFVGHIAGVQGKSAIAVGSLIGSNIANMFLILGLSGLVVKMDLSQKSLRHQLLLHLGLGFTLMFVLSQERLNLLNSLPLIGLCGVYLYLLLLDFKKDNGEHQSQEPFNAGVVIIKLFGGFGMLYLGGELLVKSGIDLCLELGISEYIVSSIFIAFGTSFPELVTSLLAAYRKKDSNLIIGNIIGSNMFNCAFILGSLGIYDFPLKDVSLVEMLALILGAAVLVILSLAKKTFSRITGAVFLVSYFAIVGFWINIF